jgi:transcriptional regulator with XRE-family HTH domain
VNTNEAPSGHLLKVERVSARVKAKQIAALMGVSPSRVASIEREEFPSTEVVQRYRAALAACQNVPHTATAA